MAKRFEFRDGSSNKFWEIALDGATFTVTFGRMGTDGQTKTKTLADASAARAEHDRLISEKTKKGYKPTSSGTASNEADALGVAGKEAPVRPYHEAAPKRVLNETRAVICRGHVIGPSSAALGDALFAWTLTHAKPNEQTGDMSLQFLAHGEDVASDWDDKPFIVGVFLREVYGLDGDHRLGLDADELAKRVSAADVRLDALASSLCEVAAAHDAKVEPRKLLFAWGGPLCSAELVKGTWKKKAKESEYYYNVEEGQPGFYFSRMGGSQDEAPGGVFGFQIATGIYDNSDPPIELTSELLASKDKKLAEHVLESCLYAFSNYD